MNDVTLSDSLSFENAKERQGIFYVVSIRKLVILYIATVGTYGFYWFYRNWDCYKVKWASREEGRENIWPIARALFSFFFVHALFREVKAYGHNRPGVMAWDNNKQAFQFAVLLVVSRVLDRVSYHSIGSPYTDILSFVILVPLLSHFSIAQEMINVSCDDPRGETNSSLTKANYAWIVVGAILWVLILIGLIFSNN